MSSVSWVNARIHWRNLRAPRLNVGVTRMGRVSWMNGRLWMSSRVQLSKRPVRLRQMMLVLANLRSKYWRS